MIGMTSHLHEERLFDCYLSVCAGDPLDPPAIEHLNDCPECAGRYAELTQFMNGLREDGNAEVDAIFTPERRQQQQRDIARRLEFVGRSARVIHFPHQVSTRQLPQAARRPFPRWVAATAAAGLVAGMVAGMFLERAGHGRPASVMARQTSTVSRSASSVPVAAPLVTPAAPVAPAPVDTAAAEAERQDRFMSELELVADRPRTEELAAYDEWTPHIREVSFRVAGR